MSRAITCQQVEDEPTSDWCECDAVSLVAGCRDPPWPAHLNDRQPVAGRRPKPRHNSQQPDGSQIRDDAGGVGGDPPDKNSGHLTGEADELTAAANKQIACTRVP